jgi:trehalose 6-phosphate phosphatase
VRKKDLAGQKSAEERVQRIGEVSPNLIVGELAQHLGECAILLDIDGTLLDLAPTPREVWVPPDWPTPLSV